MKQTYFKMESPDTLQAELNSFFCVGDFSDCLVCGITF